MVTREPHLDHLEVRAEARDTPSDQVRLGRQLERPITASIGIGARVTVLTPNQIERPVGKARRVIDARQ